MIVQTNVECYWKMSLDLYSEEYYFKCCFCKVMYLRRVKYLIKSSSNAHTIVRRYVFLPETRSHMNLLVTSQSASFHSPDLNNVKQSDMLVVTSVGGK